MAQYDHSAKRNNMLGSFLWPKAPASRERKPPAPVAPKARTMKGDQLVRDVANFLHAQDSRGETELRLRLNPVSLAFVSDRLTALDGERATLLKLRLLVGKVTRLSVETMAMPMPSGSGGDIGLRYLWEGIVRADSERLLADRPVGSFLLREKDRDAIVLSYVAADCLRHALLYIQDSDGFSLGKDGPWQPLDDVLRSLSSLINAGVRRDGESVLLEPLWFSLHHRPLSVRMPLFASLTQLELQGCPVAMLRGLSSARASLQLLSFSGSLPRCRDLLDGKEAEEPSAAAAASAEHGGGEAEAEAREAREASQWSVLRTLRISNCALESVDDSLRLLPAVTALDMSHNRIDKLLHLQDCIQLDGLDLSFNRLTTMADVNRVLGNVKRLVLRGNLLSSTDGLAKLYSLQRLDLRDNLLGSFGEVQRLVRLPCLEWLRLDGNPICVLPRYRRDTLVLFTTLRPGFVLDGKPTSAEEMEVVRSRQFTGGERALRATLSTSGSPIVDPHYSAAGLSSAPSSSSSSSSAAAAAVAAAVAGSAAAGGSLSSSLPSSSTPPAAGFFAVHSRSPPRAAAPDWLAARASADDAKAAFIPLPRGGAAQLRLRFLRLRNERRRQRLQRRQPRVVVIGSPPASSSADLGEEDRQLIQQLELLHNRREAFADSVRSFRRQLKALRQEHGQHWLCYLDRRLEPKPAPLPPLLPVTDLPSQPPHEQAAAPAASLPSKPLPAASQLPSGSSTRASSALQPTAAAAAASSAASAVSELARRLAEEHAAMDGGARTSSTAASDVATAASVASLAAAAAAAGELDGEDVEVLMDVLMGDAALEESARPAEAAGDAATAAAIVAATAEVEGAPAESNGASLAALLEEPLVASEVLLEDTKASKEPAVTPASHASAVIGVDDVDDVADDADADADAADDDEGVVDAGVDVDVDADAGVDVDADVDVDDASLGARAPSPVDADAAATPAIADDDSSMPATAALASSPPAGIDAVDAAAAKEDDVRSAAVEDSADRGSEEEALLDVFIDEDDAVSPPSPPAERSTPSPTVAVVKEAGEDGEDSSRADDAGDDSHEDDHSSPASASADSSLPAAASASLVEEGEEQPHDAASADSDQPVTLAALASSEAVEEAADEGGDGIAGSRSEEDVALERALRASHQPDRTLDTCEYMVTMEGGDQGILSITRGEVIEQDLLGIELARRDLTTLKSADAVGGNEIEVFFGSLCVYYSMTDEAQCTELLALLGGRLAVTRGSTCTLRCMACHNIFRFMHGYKPECPMCTSQLLKLEESEPERRASWDEAKALHHLGSSSYGSGRAGGSGGGSAGGGRGDEHRRAVSVAVMGGDGLAGDGGSLLMDAAALSRAMSTDIDMGDIVSDYFRDKEERMPDKAEEARVKKSALWTAEEDESALEHADLRVDDHLELYFREHIFSRRDARNTERLLHLFKLSFLRWNDTEQDGETDVLFLVTDASVYLLENTGDNGTFADRPVFPMLDVHGLSQLSRIVIGFRSQRLRFEFDEDYTAYVLLPRDKGRGYDIIQKLTPLLDSDFELGNEESYTLDAIQFHVLRGRTDGVMGYYMLYRRKKKVPYPRTLILTSDMLFLCEEDYAQCWPPGEPPFRVTYSAHLDDVRTVSEDSVGCFLLFLTHRRSLRPDKKLKMYCPYRDMKDSVLTTIRRLKADLDR